MKPEDFETVLMNSLKQTTFEVEGSTPVLAKDVLLDFKSPVFDQVGRSSCSVANTQCRCLYSYISRYHVSVGYHCGLSVIYHSLN